LQVRIEKEIESKICAKKKAVITLKHVTPFNIYIDPVRRRLGWLINNDDDRCCIAKT
jgi:hypothetical protein